MPESLSEAPHSSDMPEVSRLPGIGRLAADSRRSGLIELAGP